MPFWNDEFGKEYTDRNPQNAEDMDALYIGKYGVKRSRLNFTMMNFLVKKTASILEVGCGAGGQLDLLRRAGYENLTGLELQKYAADIARARGLDVVVGNAFDLPFENNSFEVVMTSGFLIHIPPAQIGHVMSEIARVSRWLVFGFEYYADKYVEIEYYGHRSMLWKADFARLYLKAIPGARLLSEMRVPYLENGNVDSYFSLSVPLKLKRDEMSFRKNPADSAVRRADWRETK